MTHVSRLSAAALLCLLACGPAPAPEDAHLASAALASSDCTRSFGRQPVGVMTHNLYLGAELAPAFTAQDLPQFLGATTAIWQMVVKNDFHARAQALADEIADHRPALVGLQEAFTWRTQSPADGSATPATDVAYDYAGELIAALAERGLDYRAAAVVTLSDFEAPTLLGIDIRLTDHGVILARHDVQTSNPEGHVFSTLMPISLLETPAYVQRGWVSVDANVHGQEFRFVSAHPEAYHPLVRQAQGMELAAALAGEARPVVLVGDLNSLPGTEAEAALAASGFSDTWAALYPHRAGFTCCQLEDLSLTAPPFDQRIDYVLTRGIAGPVSATVTGTGRHDRYAGLWSSDHAGLFASLRIERR